MTVDPLTSSKIKGMWRITRPLDAFIMGIGLILSMVLSGSVVLGIPPIVYVTVFIGGFLVTGHAMVVNDIIDIEIDKINEPRRVLPSGVLSIPFAKIYAIFLALIGLLLFYFIDLGGYDRLPFLWVYVLFHVLLADLYNYKLKGTGFLGNIIVAESTYGLFLAGDLFLNGKLTLVPQIVGITAFCTSLAREIYKGIIDQKGDAEHNIRTVAVVFGPRFAKYLATSILAFCLLLLVYLFTHVYFIGQLGLLIVIILLFYILSLAPHADKPKQSRRIKSLILIGPLILAPFLIVDQLYHIAFF